MIDHPRAVTIAAPAKLNLGLEITGRRDDGFHEIVTVMQTIDLVDRVELSAASGCSLEIDDPALAGSDNLGLRALLALRTRLGPDQAPGAHLKITKSIPVAAGLGGASSDAAATLLAARALWQAEVSDTTLAEIAASLGSDVPFFLHGGTMLATGRGDYLTALPDLPATWFVIVAPDLQIPGKTGRLYQSLGPADFSDGRTVSGLARALAAGEPFTSDQLANTFRRPLYVRYPALGEIAGIMHAAGAETVALSGAGPSHYAPFDSREQAARTRELLSSAFRARARVILAKSCTSQSLGANG